MQLSVIVCTYNRSHAIIDCLDSIVASLDHAAPVDAEIVIVDNSSTDNTSAIVRGWAVGVAWPVSLVAEAKQGLSNARNRGIATARGDLLAFTDDDCRLTLDYVRDALRHDAADPELALRGGRVELGDSTDLPITIKTKTDREVYRRCDKAAKQENLANCIVGANMVMRREVAEKIGPFDWRFGTSEVPAGEDADYVFRAYLADIKIEYVPDMAVVHFHGRKTNEQAAKLFRNYMIGSGALYAKHVTRDYNLARQLVWDVKGAGQELMTRKNLFWPDIGFWNTDKVSCYLIGWRRYYKISLQYSHPRRSTVSFKAIAQQPANSAANNTKNVTMNSSNHRMADLSAQLDICRPVLKGRLVYLDYPVHHNVGDLLIWKGTREFFKRHKLRLHGQYSIDNVGPRARQAMDEADTICFHGGGNLGDLWPWYQENRERIIAAYPHKRIVILPQSVHFDNPQAFDRACAVFRAHPDLHIFLRDVRSLATLEAKAVPNVKLSPDMAHALWGVLKAPAATTSEALYLFRRDKESSGLSHVAGRQVKSVDWNDLLTGYMKKAYDFGIRINRADGGKGHNRLPALGIWKTVSDMLIQRGVALFAPHETIITDRLHAGILAALLQRQAIVYDNSYGKISTYFDCWMQGVPGIELRRAEAEQLDDVAELPRAG
jgi:exopolysaccharide biosynthesis predicted pyruvyltransferase EpsI/GT2 family glycosyltransferase